MLHRLSPLFLALCGVSVIAFAGAQQGSVVLPSQGGNAGDCLTTNGSKLSWGSCSSGGGGGTVTSVTGGTGLSGGTITTSGTLAVINPVPSPTPSGGLLTNNGTSPVWEAIPTWNQNTTGSAAKWTIARNLAGNSVDGSANVAFSNAFIVQGTTDTGLSGAQFLGALATGLVKNTTSTGVLSIAVAGTDYAPAISPIVQPYPTPSPSGTYTSLCANRTVILTGNSYSIVLPDATTAGSCELEYLHNGTSLTQVYTLYTVSSQTIGGIVSGSYALYTEGESLTLLSDGTNWQVKMHLTSTAPTSAGTITFTNGTPGTTSANNVSWYRQGANAIIQYTLIQTGAGTPGATMPYLIGLPTNLTFASTIVPDTTTGPELLNPGAGTAIIPSSAAQLVAISSGTGAMSPCVPIAYSTTTFRLSGYEIGNNEARGPYDFGPEATDFTFAETSLYMNVTLIAPIAGWEP